MRQEFTFEEAFDIQEKHINQWEVVLNIEAFVRLTRKVKERNKKGYRSPYDVARGTTLDQYVADITREMMNEAKVN